MEPERTYITRNAATRERLAALVARLGDAELAQPIGDGWTVAVALAHLATWDERTLAVIEAWERAGAPPAASDADAINAAALPAWQAQPPRAAAQAALTAAAAVDQKIAGLPAELAAAIAASGRRRTLDWSLHRREHLDAIDATLRSQPSG